MERYKWVFHENGGTANGDNIAGKIFEKNYTPLVRESLQNSLDAFVKEDEPVKVSFNFGKIDLPSSSSFFDLEKWVEGGMRKFPNKDKRVYKNLNNIKEELSLCKRRGYISYLEVSDENTTGMDYTSDLEKQSDTGFYSFVKSLGNSTKQGTGSGGSHGVGKVMFQKISKLNTIFVSSKWHENGSEFFEGVCEISTSLISNKEYEYRGYYCLDDTQEPTDQHDKIPEKFQRKKSGTSVFILGVDDKEEERQKRIIEIKKAIVENYWLAILQKTLIVQIEDEVYEGDDILRLANEVCQGSNIQKYIEAVYFAGTDKKHIHITKTLPILKEVHLYILKDKNGENRIQNMRKTKMLIKTDSMANYGFYGVFVCEGKDGNEILKLSENAEHNQWNSNECEEESDRVKARRAIVERNQFISSELQNIFGSNNTNKADISGAEAYLYMDVSLDELEESDAVVENGKTKVNDFQDHESPIQTTLFGDFKEEKQKKESFGHIEIEEDTSALQTEDGELRGGYNKNNSDNPDPKPPHPNPGDETYKEEKSGTSGIYIRPIKVKYRPYFQKESETIYHYISLTPEKDCTDAKIELIVTGDDDDIIYIEQSSHGTPHENTITGLSFSKDTRLLLKVKFEDNLPHPIILKAYEHAK